MAGFCSSVQVALEVQVVEQANHNSDTVMAEPQVLEPEVQVPSKKCLTPLLDVVTSSTGTSLPPQPAGYLSLPVVVSKTKPNKPLTTVDSRRSPRLNSIEGFQHIQMDGTRRKKRRQ